MTIKGRGLGKMLWRAVGCRPLLYSISSGRSIHPTADEIELIPKLSKSGWQKPLFMFFSDSEGSNLEAESCLQRITNLFKSFKVKVVEQLKATTQYIDVSLA